MRQYPEALALLSLSSQGSCIAIMSQSMGLAELIMYCCVMRILLPDV